MFHGLITNTNDVAVCLPPCAYVITSKPYLVAHLQKQGALILASSTYDCFLIAFVFYSVITIFPLSLSPSVPSRRLLPHGRAHGVGGVAIDAKAKAIIADAVK
jgi:hypothetical protein